MLCIAALIVLSILSIFSAAHRDLTREAFDCVFRRVTLRPCNTGFQDKIKGKVLAYLLARSPFLARIFHKHFAILSFVFVVLMLVSTIWSVRGGYNYFFYGSCNGLNASGFCAFDPHGEHNKVTAINATCGLAAPTEDNLRINKVNLNHYPVKNKNNKVRVVFIGCYECDYTRASYEDISRLADIDNVEFVFLHYPAKAETINLSRIDYCAYQADQNKFWQLNNLFFTENKADILNEQKLRQMITAAGYDAAQIMTCAQSDKTIAQVNANVVEMEKSGLYGTPTVFIGERAFVGPKPYRVYRWEVLKQALINI